MAGSRTRPTSLGRREMLRAAGVLGAGMLAGCSAGDAEDDSGSGGGSGRRAFVSVTGIPIDDLQFNSYNQNNLADSEYLFDNLIYYQSRDDRFLPGVVADWDVTEKRVVLSVREGVPWHDGGDVTAEDVARKLKIEFYNGSSLGNYIPVDGVAATDRYTVELPFETPISEEIFINEMVGIAMDTPKAAFQPFLDDFEDGGDGVNEEGTALASYVVRNPNANGPFAFERRTERELVLERVARHPDAADINFPQYRIRYLQDNQGTWQALNNGTIDGVPVLYAPPNIVDGFPDSVREYLTTPNWGVAITWNFEHKHYGQRVVRQAIAHAVDRKAVAGNSGPRTKRPVDIPTGIVGNIPDDSGGRLPANEWLGDRIDQYEPYRGQNFERAAELLEGAGFQKDDGTWYDADGDPLTFSVKVPGGWTDYVAAVQTFNQHLSDFGLVTELVARDSSAYYGQDLYGSAGFEICMLEWTTGRAYPYFNFAFLFDSPVQADIRHYPKETTLPPVENPDGDPTTYRPAEMLPDLATVEPGSEKETRLIQRLAWIVNQDLPALPLQETIDQAYIVTDGWNTVTSKDPDANVDRPPTYLPRVGKLKAADGNRSSTVTPTNRSAAFASTNATSTKNTTER